MVNFRWIAGVVFSGVLLASGIDDQQPVPKPVDPSAVTATPPIPQPGDPIYAPIATNKEQSVKEKFVDYSIVTFGPRALFTPAFVAAIRMAHPPDKYPGEWRHGMGGYGRLYGSSLARGASERTAQFITAAVFHEDFRYRPSTSKNALGRTFHALAFTFVDRSDSGRHQIALSNFAAAGAGGFVGNLYLPSGYDDLRHAETRTATAFASLAMRNVLREFAPEIYRFTHRRHVPFPRVPIPEWWTGR